jgi:hypothetical protein
MLGALAFCSSVSAQNKIAESGFYGFASAGPTTIKETLKPTSGSSWSASSTAQTNGWELGLGYDFNKNLAAEISLDQPFNRTSSQSISYTGGSQTIDQTSKTWGLRTTLLGKLPLGEGAVLLAGPTLISFQHKTSSSLAYSSSGASVSSSSSQSFSKTLYGITVGAEMPIDKRTDVRLTYTKFQPWTVNYTTYTDVINIESIQVGIAVKF